MLATDQSEVDRVVFDTEMVRIEVLSDAVDTTLRSATLGRREIAASFFQEPRLRFSTSTNRAFAAKSKCSDVFTTKGQSLHSETRSAQTAIAAIGSECDLMLSRMWCAHSIRRLTRTGTGHSGLHAVGQMLTRTSPSGGSSTKFCGGRPRNHWQSRNPLCACSNESCEWRIAGNPLPAFRLSRQGKTRLYVHAGTYTKRALE